MKCVTIAAIRTFYSGVMTPGVFVVQNPYPQATDGIAVNRHAGSVLLDSYNKFNVDADLLEKAPDTKSGLANVMRASVELGADGFFKLVAERPGDEEGVLALFDVGFAPGRWMVYEAKPGTKLASGMVNDLFSGDEEVALFLLTPGDEVAAVRTERKYIFFGPRVLTERVVYTYGSDFTCDKQSS